MITTFEAVILGIVQGLTEFLPVSSSGHLVLFQTLFGLEESPLLFDIVLHSGTFLATIIVFRKQCLELLKAIPRTPVFFKNLFQKGHLAIGDDTHAWLLFLISVSTLITGTIGVLFHDTFARAFSSLAIVSITLFVTGMVLFSTRSFNPKKGKHSGRATMKDAFIVGLSQGLAILPGLSRSGTTISTGLFLGFSREFAGEYSFLISLPAIAGAVVLELSKISTRELDVFPVMVGFIASFLFGLFSLKILLSWIRQGKLFYFAFYCWVMSLFSAVIAFRS